MRIFKRETLVVPRPVCAAGPRGLRLAVRFHGTIATGSHGKPAGRSLGKMKAQHSAPIDRQDLVSFSFWLRHNLVFIATAASIMKLGLLTDIHEDLKHLQIALNRFEQQQVDQIVVLGDLVCMNEELEQTCRLLKQAGVIGVWGNHDLGLCHQPDEDVRGRYPPIVLDFMASLKPRLQIGDCHFSHVEPWLNPMDPLEINYYEGPPDEPHKLARIFNAVPARWMFAGHYHRWLLVTPERIESWSGIGRLRLHQDRCFVVIGAICDGRFAIFDTDSAELTPYNEFCPTA
jgi:predicted phosphodiesterase